MPVPQIDSRRNLLPVAHSQFVVTTGAPVVTAVPSRANLVWVSCQNAGAAMEMRNGSGAVVAIVYGAQVGLVYSIPESVVDIRFATVADTTCALSFFTDTSMGYD